MNCKSSMLQPVNSAVVSGHHFYARLVIDVKMNALTALNVRESYIEM